MRTLLLSAFILLPAVGALAQTTTGAPAKEFTLATGAESVTLSRGGTATLKMDLLRSKSYVGRALELRAQHDVAGLEVGFDPAVATGESTTVTLKAASNAPAGTHYITLNGRTTTASRSRTLMVVIQ